MNTITHGGESFDFETVDELLATPLVLAYAHVEHMACDGKSLWAHEDGMLKLIGRFKEPVRMPAQICVPVAPDDV